MKFVVNEGKKVEIEVNGDIYLRHAIKTRFIHENEDYIKIINQYAKDIYEPGDILSISEKIISLCQNRIIKREELPITFWAKFLSKFASKENRGGYGVGMPINMQYAINKVGLPKILLASILGGIGKLFKISGIFYKIAGREVSGLDGFYDGSWNYYKNIGIEIPENPDAVCNEIKQKTNISCMIVDANDFGQVILGKSNDIKVENETLIGMIKDNPANQFQERTPLVLIRKKKKG